MSKILVWLGYFDSESDFEKYIDQSAFYKWWKEYEEDNKELRCQFCKELGIMDYDEDFLIIKYSPNGIEELLNVVPVDTYKIRKALKDQNITNANAAIIYNCCEGISSQKAANTITVSFLGTFTFDLNPTGTLVSTAGLKYMTWIGHTDKSKSEFMEYFNQDQYLREKEEYESGQTKKRPNPDHRCQFCKDLGIKFYYPEFLRIKIDEMHSLNSVELIQSVIKNDKMFDGWIERTLDRENLDNSSNNSAFCYIPNGFKDKKKNQSVFILKESMKGLLGLPKKHVEDIGLYNGLSFLWMFEWE